MARNRQSSKLAVILHADIAGSTALVHQDEHLAHERIQDAFHRFGDTIRKYQGRVCELRGDALLAQFERASDAVNAALAFQAYQFDYNAGLSDAIRPTLRIGVAMGEVVAADNTLTGAGVVLAQRVEQLAEPGGVCITGAIHEALPQRLPFDRGSLGEQQVKGFDEPVRVYAVRLRDGAELPKPPVVSEIREAPVIRWVTIAAAIVLIVGGIALAWLQPWAPEFEPAVVEKMAFPLPNKPSIAVLPFDNYSGEEKLNFFADGLTENITSALSKAPGLFVIARNSAATYKGKAVNVKQVAEDLGVQYVLEGSVQKSGDQLRVTAQLVDAIKGYHLWTDRFDREAKDIFAVQDEITKRVFTELQVKLTEGEHARMAAGGTRNLEAWLLRVEAYSEYIKFTRESQIRARELYQAASEADPNWAFPVAGVAFTHWYEARRGWSDSRDESVRLGIGAAERAIKLQPDEAIGYMALGNLMLLNKQPKKGIELRRKAVELAPNSFAAVGGLAIRLSELDQEQEAVELFERAIRLSPKHPWWVEFGYGLALHLVGRKEDAVDMYKKGINTGTGAQNAPLHARLAAVYADIGRMDAAKVEMDEALRLNPEFTVTEYQKSYPFPSAERNTWYKDLLLRSGMPEHPPLALPDKPSIAVLPFTNMSGDAQQEYFADGLTDDLITDLSKVTGLFVIARNSVFTFKGKPVRIKMVAEELGVRYIVEGSVQRSGNRVRVNAQLVEGNTGHHLWAERYDREITDLFAVQDELVSQIVSALAVQLTRTEKTRLTHRPAPEFEAYDLYLKARDGYFSRDQARMRESLDLYAQAIAIDPTFARAYAGLAQVAADVWRLGSISSLGPGAVVKKMAEDAARKALSLDPILPDAHAVLALLRLVEGDHGAALQSARRAVELDPNNADAYTTLAIVLGYAGQPEAALEAIRVAVRLNPRPPPYLTTYYGWVLFLNRKYDEAIAVLEPIAETQYRGVADAPREILAMAYAENGLLDMARAQVKSLREQQPYLNLAWYRVMYDHHARQEDLHLRLDALRKAGMPEWPLGFHGDPKQRLTGPALQDLVSGKTWSGRDAGRELPFIQEFAGNGQTVYAAATTLLNGKAFIKGDELCERFQGYIFGRDLCGPVYRNPAGAPKDSNGYVYANPLTVRYFSLPQ